MMHDIRLEENFKLFLSGPSRCGKTSFISTLLENISSFAKQPPTKNIYIYTLWQTKFDEMQGMVNVFIKDNSNILEQIKTYVTGEPMFIIFDDMINSTSLPDIAWLFTVDGRHMNLSMAFLTQQLFVNNEHFRQIYSNQTLTLNAAG